MRVAIYSRKSRYSESGDSVDNQIEVCKEYFNKFKHKKIDFHIFEDEGWSGASINRPEMMKLVSCIEQKSIDYVVVYRLDRISRSVVDFSNLIEMMNKNGVYFISVKEQFDTSTPMGRAMMYISSVFAQLERETIAERIKDNMYKLAERGVWLGGVTPKGYRSVKKEYLKDGVSKKAYYSLEIEESEIEFIKMLFKYYVECGSLAKLVTKVKELGYGEYSASSFSLFLRNTVYVRCDHDVVEYLNSKGIQVYGESDGIHGVIGYGKDSNDPVYAIGEHIGCIDSNLWLEAQRMLDKNAIRAPRLGTGNKGLFRGYLKCGLCNSNMTLTYKLSSCGIKHFYYICSTKRRKGKDTCNCKNINGNKLDKFMLNMLQEDDRFNYYIKDDESHYEELNILKCNIDAKEKTAARLVSVISDLEEGITRERFMNKLKGLDSDITELKNMLDSKKLNIEAAKCLNDVEWDREFIENIIESAVWDSNKRTVEVKFLDSKLDSVVYRIDDLRKMEF